MSTAMNDQMWLSSINSSCNAFFNMSQGCRSIVVTIWTWFSTRRMSTKGRWFGVFHDESTFYANDETRLIWQDDQTDLIPKTNGSSLMVSALMHLDVASRKVFEPSYKNTGLFKRVSWKWGNKLLCKEAAGQSTRRFGAATNMLVKS